MCKSIKKIQRWHHTYYAIFSFSFCANTYIMIVAWWTYEKCAPKRNAFRRSVLRMVCRLFSFLGNRLDTSWIVCVSDTLCLCLCTSNAVPIYLSVRRSVHWNTLQHTHILASSNYFENSLKQSDKIFIRFLYPIDGHKLSTANRNVDFYRSL